MPNEVTNEETTSANGGAVSDASTPETGQAVEAETTTEEVSSEIDPDTFDPTGTFALILVYFAILVVSWVVLYFVEFLGNGPTVVG